MRINKYIAMSSDLSRRSADSAIMSGRVTVNDKVAQQGIEIGLDDVVTLDGHVISPVVSTTTLMLNKPTGYVCSRDGQGSYTIYDLLPANYHRLNPVGRLDKDSSGLLLLTDDGALAQELTHPRYQKTKIYEVILDKPLEPLHQQMISDIGVQLEDGRSQFLITKIDTLEESTPLHGKHDKIPNRTVHNDAPEPAHSAGASEKRAGEERADSERSDTGTRGRGEPLLNNGRENLSTTYQVTMHEGRNRQIRRTFAALGYTVTHLHRTHFGPYSLGDLKSGQTKIC